MAQLGRKSWEKELEMRNLWELSIPVLKHALTSPKIPFAKKVDVALHLTTKMFPKDANINLNNERPIDVYLKLFDGTTQSNVQPQPEAKGSV